MGGLETMSREPDFLIVIDPNLHTTAVREAKVKRIPVVALANVDADPDVIDYLVPGNDKSRMSVSWFLGNVEKAIREGLAERVIAKEKEAIAKEPEVKAKKAALYFHDSEKKFIGCGPEIEGSDGCRRDGLLSGASGGGRRF